MALLTLLAGAGWDDRPGQWDALVYPDADNLAVHERIAGFGSFELCRQAAIGRLGREADPEAGDYECRYKCKRHTQFSGYICQETRR